MCMAVLFRLQFSANMSNIEACTSTQRSTYRPSVEHQPTESRSPFRRSRGLFAILRRKFASKSVRSNDESGECHHSYNIENVVAVCSSWRSRPRHVDKPIRPAYSDECLSCCASSRCIRSRSHRNQQTSQDFVVPETSTRGKKCALICQHCHKKTDQSPSDFDSSDHELSQSEEEKVRNILPIDTEYGHASAPVAGASQVVTCDVSCTHSLTSDSTSDSIAGPSCIDHALNHHALGCESHGEVTFETQPVQPTPPFYDRVKEVPKGWSLSQELFRLSKYGWYWGPITRVEAEEKLTNQADGAFLVRDSSDERYLLSLSFRSYGRTLHTRIEHCNGVFSFYAQHESEGYSSIVDLIEHSMTDSQSGVFCYSRARLPGSPSFPVRLAKPVSRFAQVRSLQYLCRFVIRQFTRVDHIQQLPLPTSIKGWLEESQY